MILVDTSVWVEVLRDRSGRVRAALDKALGGDDAVLCRFHQLELLQGARDEREWSLLKEYLDAQDYLECSPETWGGAARIYFELRRAGKTVRSPIDCCIAQLAMDHDVLLLHRDRDYEVISEVRPLRQLRLA
ncbi:MAG TPA: PIN domain nuclease [Thermoanaerobaculia bacterium]|nr:PIN domain nuclease [Thermoanaerobaculia bacterium]